MKAVVVALFALVAVASALPVDKPAAAPVAAPAASAKEDLKGAETAYVAAPYVAAYPAVSSYYAAAAVPAVSTYSAYSAVPAVGYAAPAYTAYAASPYYY